MTYTTFLQLVTSEGQCEGHLLHVSHGSCLRTRGKAVVFLPGKGIPHSVIYIFQGSLKKKEAQYHRKD